MKDLIAKINAGKYTLSTKDPLTIECCLFLSQCLQANESDRISADDLSVHPFINIELPKGEVDVDLKLTILDHDAFQEEISHATELNAGAHMTDSSFVTR